MPDEDPEYQERLRQLRAIATDLIDELRLLVFPLVLGRGKRLFGDNLDQAPCETVKAP